MISSLFGPDFGHILDGRHILLLSNATRSGSGPAGVLRWPALERDQPASTNRSALSDDIRDGFRSLFAPIPAAGTGQTLCVGFSNWTTSELSTKSNSSDRVLGRHGGQANDV
jgi:hypothetical protein